MNRPIPRADAAVVAEEKLRDYLLSPAHPIGRFKAAFFAQLGYSQGNWERLAGDLRSQHLPLAAEPIQSPPFGRKYRIVGPLTGPAGRTAEVVSIWMVRSGEEIARFVTLYPNGP